MQKKAFDKRLIMVILACIIVSSTVAGLLIFKAVKANKFIIRNEVNRRPL